MSSDLQPTPQPPQRRSRFLLTAVLSLAALILLMKCTGVIDVMSKALDFGQGLMGVAEKLWQQQIHVTFRENLLKISPTKGDILELATMEMEETLTKSDTLTLINLVPLGETVSEIKVPVVYRYHLKLSDEWRLHAQDGHCVVVAPIIRPSLPPAIRTNLMEKKTQAGWARFNAAENLDTLERSITPMTELRAASPGKLDKVRDGARKSVAEFVKAWLLKEQQWRQGSISQITVLFADEPEAQNSTSLPQLKREPTATLLP